MPRDPTRRGLGGVPATASGPSASNASNPASSRIGRPSSRALVSFEPAFSPTTTKSVLFDTLPAALPPRDQDRLLGGVAGVAGERSGDHHGQPLRACAARTRRARRASAPRPPPSGRGSRGASPLGREPVQDRLGDHRADPVDLRQHRDAPHAPGRRRAPRAAPPSSRTVEPARARRSDRRCGCSATTSTRHSGLALAASSSSSNVQRRRRRLPRGQRHARPPRAAAARPWCARPTRRNGALRRTTPSSSARGWPVSGSRTTTSTSHSRARLAARTRSPSSGAGVGRVAHQVEQVRLVDQRRRSGHLRLGQRRRRDLAERLDVQCAARADVLDPAAHLRRAGPRVRAAQVHLALAHRAQRRAALRARGRHDEVPARQSSSAARGAGPTISGMTSPALRSTTMSPIRTPLARTTSWLCSVAIDTVEPATRTGSMTPNGVTRPVRPTFTSMPSSRVLTSSGGYL